MMRLPLALLVWLALAGLANAQFGPTATPGYLSNNNTAALGFPNGNLIGAGPGQVVVDTGVKWASIPSGAFSRLTYRQATSTNDLITPNADYFICAQNFTAPANEFLPYVPTQTFSGVQFFMAGVAYVIKDCAGKAATYPITVYGNGNAIDGQGYIILNTNYQSVSIIWTDTGNANRGNMWMTYANNITPAGGLIYCSNRLDFTTGCNSAYRGALL